MANQKTRLLGGILFVAGTSIGAGALALPLVTAAYGFWPAVMLFLGSWFFMLLAALFMLEVNLWLPLEANIISMAKKTLGIGGQITAWIFYLLLLYILMAAYLAGINSLLKASILYVFHVQLSTFYGIVLLTLGSLFIIYLGIRAMDFLNRFFMLGLTVCYFLLVILLVPHIQVPQLITASLYNSWLALPVIMCSFGFQIIVPTLRIYLNGDVATIKRAIIIGSSIPLIVYIIWEAVILGVLPVEGPNSLLSLLTRGQPAVELVQALQQLLKNPLVSSAASLFSFLVIITSFIGVSLSLFHFLSDGLASTPFLRARPVVIILTTLPSAVFVLLYPSGFIMALGYAGTCVAILLGIFPVLMAWRGRYILKLEKPGDYRVPGGRISMLFVLLCSLIVIALEWWGKG
jgi:tyrosine-specific transport protein